MKLKCPDSQCSAQFPHPKSDQFVRKGHFFRSSDGRWIQRFRCRLCSKNFSHATLSACYLQKKRKLNFKINQLLNSGVSQRRAARILQINEKTVVRKFRFLAEQARLKHKRWLELIPPLSVTNIQFDDLETAEHSKCKPLSVTLAVEPKNRKILAFQVSRMPARGHLSAIALKKYGPRPDERPQGWNTFFASLTPIAHPQAEWSSDQNPHYPRYLKAHHPHCKHTPEKGQRGSIAGQGELKKIGFDPLFSLNHTCAMLRANLNRLFRRTWCITKTVQGLIDHLSMYVWYHNTVLTPEWTHASPSGTA